MALESTQKRSLASFVCDVKPTLLEATSSLWRGNFEKAIRSHATVSPHVTPALDMVSLW